MNFELVLSIRLPPGVFRDLRQFLFNRPNVDIGAEQQKIVVLAREFLKIVLNSIYLDARKLNHFFRVGCLLELIAILVDQKSVFLRDKTT